MAANSQDRRLFEPIIVGNCVVQQGSVRYSEPWEELEEERLLQFAEYDEDDDEPEDPMDEMALLYRSTYRAGAPRICAWRSNLVALSQKYNLYFAAYRSDLHVTQPRNIKNTLPPRSDLIIRPPKTAAGARTPGALDPFKAHCMNHIIVGNLGDREIILLSFDDGDVIAYDTQKIMSCFEDLMASKTNHVKSDSSYETPFCPLDPFFAENVGSSAWGLAIHENSRLIAVGSNLREVTVFIFALTEPGQEETVHPTADTTFPLTAPGLLHNSDKPDRSRNHRRVMKLGPEGHNIPSLDFGDDKDSQARSVIATDIVGNIWILSIWDDARDRVRSYKKLSNDASLMGWSVLVLKPGCFKPVPTTPQETLGLGAFDVTAAKLVVDFSRFDVSSTCIDAIDGPSKWPTRVLSGLESIEDDDTDVMTKADVDENRRFDGRTRSDMLLRFLGIADKRRLAELKSPGKLKSCLTSSKDTNTVQADLESSSTLLPDGSFILRGQRWDLELIPPDNSVIPTVCKGMLASEHTFEMHQLRPIHRLNLVACIPELSLVLVASQAGRVALITLTMPKIEDTRMRAQPMFRIDYILPFQSQNVRPPFPLLGMAVSPVPDNMAQKRKETRSAAPHRWRLMLHYYDHTILSYELSREATCNGLKVF